MAHGRDKLKLDEYPAPKLQPFHAERHSCG